MNGTREDLARENEQLKAQVERLNTEKGNDLWLVHMVRMYKDLERENERLKAQVERLRVEKDDAIWCANGFCEMFGRIAENNGAKFAPLPGEKKWSTFAMLKFFIVIFYRLFLMRKAGVC